MTEAGAVACGRSPASGMTGLIEVLAREIAAGVAGGTGGEDGSITGWATVISPIAGSGIEAVDLEGAGLDFDPTDRASF